MTRNLSPSMNLFLLSPGICHRREQLSCGSFGFYWSRQAGNSLCLNFIFNHLVCYQIFVILFPDDTTPQFLRKLNRSFDYRYYPVHKGKAQGNQGLLFQTLRWHANRLKRYKYLHNISDQDVNTLRGWVERVWIRIFVIEFTGRALHPTATNIVSVLVAVLLVAWSQRCCSYSY